MGLLVNGLGMEIERADENVPAGFDLPRQIFLACEVLNRLSVCPEHLEFILPVAAKVIVERLAADFASHARISVLTKKKRRRGQKSNAR
jgi:hypothetical protein